MFKMTIAPRKENEFPFILKNGMFGFCLVGIFIQNLLRTQNILNFLLLVLTLILISCLQLFISRWPESES